jgi:ATP/maltotriose-dependent transcriptional regulator MalT
MSNDSTLFGLENTTHQVPDPLDSETTPSCRCVNCITKRWGRRDLHAALRLALQLAGSLNLVRETEEADSLLLRALSIGCFAGLYQVFVEGGQEIEPLSSEVLSAREGDVLRLVGRGMSNKRIAQALTITPETVKSHVKRIFIKLEVKSRAAAVSRAAALGLIRLGELSSACGG